MCVDPRAVQALKRPGPCKRWRATLCIAVAESRGGSHRVGDILPEALDRGTLLLALHGECTRTRNAERGDEERASRESC